MDLIIFHTVMHLFLGQPYLCCRFCNAELVIDNSLFPEFTLEKVLNPNEIFPLSEASDDYLTVGSGHTGERNRKQCCPGLRLQLH